MQKFAGFTLVEVLLGLAMFSVIALSLYVTYANGIRINRKTRQIEEIYQEVRLLLDAVTLDLENMVPYTGPVAGFPHAGFYGEETSLSFVSIADTGLKRTQYSLYSLEHDQVHHITVGRVLDKNVSMTVKYVESSDNKSFMREEQLFDVFAEGKAESEIIQEILSREVLDDSLKFFYAEKVNYKQPGADTVLWEKQWTKSYLPAGVRIQISFSNPDTSGQPVEIQKDILIPAGMWGR